MKMYLKRIKKFDVNPNQPDYETFFKGAGGKIFHGVGYLQDLSSNMTIKIELADFANRHQRKEFEEHWRNKI